MHKQAALNDVRPVEPGHVRASNRYAVRVSPANDPANSRHAFVYMSIPRSGRQPGYTRLDGAEFAAAARQSMSWATAVYKNDMWVEITRLRHQPDRASPAVVIRPTTLDLETEWTTPDTLRIHVPWREAGYRFSVEFEDDLFTSYNDLKGIAGHLTEDPAGRAIHTEPRHALLIFAEPENPALEPTTRDGVIHYPAEGQVLLDQVTDADILYFRPGVYWMPGTTHAYLPERIRWVYLAPGAYLKGALEFRGDAHDYRVTGYGVLSGENYVYEPDRRNQYGSRREADGDCHGSCVKMLQFYSSAKPQRLLVQGITVVEPPYHSFVVHGNPDSMITDFAHYKQVGAWYWQTDGVELYRGGSIRNSFLHANDDVFKLYHSDVKVQDCVVWKSENGPVFQWGWVPRAMENITVDGVDIIHNRMFWNDLKHNTGLFNAARHYRDDQAFNTADPGLMIRNLHFRNIRSEGLNAAVFRLYALSNWDNITFDNIWIEQWNGLNSDIQQSQLKRMSNQDRARFTEISRLRIHQFRVGKETITRAAGNWQAHASGRLNFDADLWTSWEAD